MLTVEIRDRLHAIWAANAGSWTAGERALIKHAFCAGWDARAKADALIHERAVDWDKNGGPLGKHLDETDRLVLGLFPTEAELEPK